MVEIASNDGYLLRYFKEAGVPVLGIEPAQNAAEAAEAAGIRTIVRFFGLATATDLAAAGEAADLIVANNVLAHVPLLNDFVSGFRALLGPDGVATLEFPHLSRLIEKTEFDTIYHEHFSYFSLLAVERVFAQNGLTIFDVEELPTHGGSLRIYACRSDEPRPVEPTVVEVGRREEKEGLHQLGTYAALFRTGRGRQAQPARVPGLGKTRRQSRRRLRSAGQGQHPAQLLRHPRRLRRLRRRSQPAQAGAASYRARTSRSSTLPGSPRRGRTTS